MHEAKFASDIPRVLVIAVEQVGMKCDRSEEGPTREEDLLRQSGCRTAEEFFACKDGWRNEGTIDSSNSSPAHAETHAVSLSNSR